MCVCLYVQMSALAGAQQLLYIHNYLQTHIDYQLFTGVLILFDYVTFKIIVILL